MKGKKLHDFWKRTAVVSLSVALLTLTAGCGEKKEEADAILPEYSYVPEYIELDEGQNYYQSVIVGNNLYNQVYEFDEETMTATQRIVKYAIEDGKLGEETTILTFSQNDGVQNFVVDDAGNLYCVMERYPEMPEEEAWTEDYYNNRQTLLCKYDVQGNAVYEQEITKLLAVEGDMYGGYVENLAVDKEGRVYVSCNSELKLFDENGKHAGDMQMEGGHVGSMGCGKDGKVYVTYFDEMSEYGGYVLGEVDFAGKKVAKSYKNFNGNYGNSLLPGIEKDFLTQDGSNVYEYDMESQTSELLFSWVDCDINGSYVDNMAVTEDGRIVVITNDWNTGVGEMAVLTKTKTSELVPKEILTLGALYDNQSTQAAVVAFNKASDKYRIRIKTYLDVNEWSETSYSDAVSRLNNDIISGKNCPDILDVSALNVTQLAAKGVFENLTPYLDNSMLLDKDDYLESVLEGFTYKDTLISIPYSFNLETVMGKTADVGSDMGWSLDEMMSFCEKHPGVQLFDYATKETIMYYCLLYNESAFIDWEKSTCNFDSEEFKKLLTFVNSFPDDIDGESDTRSTPEKIAAGDVLLNMSYVSSYDEIQYNIAQFGGEEVTCIGYPDMAGGSGCIMTVEDTYAISSKSKNKEAAWEFIESKLAQERDMRGHSWGFSTRKSELAKQREEAVKVEYLTDENGELVLDEMGVPIELGGGGGSVMIGDGSWSYSYHKTTEEEADMVDELIANAKPVFFNTNEQIHLIISEAAEAYYKGQKTVDDVAKVIQSRVKLFLEENQ